MAKRRDEPTPKGDVEEDFHYVDREVTGSDMALVREEGGGRETLLLVC